jgi:hypothetical protein
MSQNINFTSVFENLILDRTMEISNNLTTSEGEYRKLLIQQNEIFDQIRSLISKDALELLMEYESIDNLMTGVLIEATYKHGIKDGLMAGIFVEATYKHGIKDGIEWRGLNNE